MQKDDGDGEDEKTKKAAAAAAAAAAARIVVVPPLDSYELQMAEVILDPDDIESSFADIGGLDQAKQEIYELAVLPLVQPDLFSTHSKLIRPVKGTI
jgi:ATP-dependent 26S proteasome regulatory subunit